MHQRPCLKSLRSEFPGHARAWWNGGPDVTGWGMGDVAVPACAPYIPPMIWMMR